MFAAAGAAAPRCWSARKAQRATCQPLLKVIACWRNRVEITFGELTDRMELAAWRHTFWGLLTRTAQYRAHTLLRVCRQICAGLRPSCPGTCR